MASTPIRGLRIPDDEWEAWRAAAATEGVSVTAWVRRRCGGDGLSLAAGCADPTTGEVRLPPTNDELRAANNARPKIADSPLTKSLSCPEPGCPFTVIGRGAKARESVEDHQRSEHQPCAHKRTTSRGPLKDCDDCGMTKRLDGTWS